MTPMKIHSILCPARYLKDSFYIFHSALLYNPGARARVKIVASFDENRLEESSACVKLKS